MVLLYCSIFKTKKIHLPTKVPLHLHTKKNGPSLVAKCHFQATGPPDLSSLPTAHFHWNVSIAPCVKTRGILSKHRENTGNFVSSTCKCSDSKSKGYCDSCCKKNPFFSRCWISLPSQFCVCNTHKLCKLAEGKFAVGQGKHRKNTGNLKTQFELVACHMNVSSAPCGAYI